MNKCGATSNRETRRVHSTSFKSYYGELVKYGTIRRTIHLNVAQYVSAKSLLGGRSGGNWSLYIRQTTSGWIFCLEWNIVKAASLPPTGAVVEAHSGGEGEWEVDGLPFGGASCDEGPTSSTPSASVRWVNAFLTMTIDGWLWSREVCFLHVIITQQAKWTKIYEWWQRSTPLIFLSLYHPLVDYWLQSIDKAHRSL